MRRWLLRSYLSLLLAWVAMLGPSVFCAAESAPKVARVAFIDPYSPQGVTATETTALLVRLQELGWVQGQNLILEPRWAVGRIDRLPTLMSDVISRGVDVIVTRGTPAAIAAKNATSTIPIVIATMGDPVGTGIVTSLAHPAGNLTGLSLEATEDFSGKWIELLQETVPKLSSVAVVSNPESAYVRKIAKDLESAALKRGVKLRFIDVHEPSALASAFQQARRKTQGALVLPDPLLVAYRQQVCALAASNRLPAMYTVLEFMDSGALMAYAADSTALYRRAAEYVDKILRGAKPADLPIEQPTQFKLIVNLKTARGLGLTLPESILLRADEVIK